MAGGKDGARVLTEISLLLAALFWSTNYAATKFATQSLSPLRIVAFRFALAGVLMYGTFVYWNRKAGCVAGTCSRWPGWAVSASARLPSPSDSA